MRRRWVKPTEWYHAFAVSEAGMRTATLDQRRVELPRVDTVYDAGWHLSYFMSLADIVRKARHPARLCMQRHARRRGLGSVYGVTCCMGLHVVTRCTLGVYNAGWHLSYFMSLRSRCARRAAPAGAERAAGASVCSGARGEPLPGADERTKLLAHV